MFCTTIEKELRHCCSPPCLPSFLLVPSSSLQHPLIPTGSDQHSLAPTGTHQHLLTTTGTHHNPIGTHWHSPASIGIYYHPQAFTGTYWHLLALTGIHWHPLAASVSPFFTSHTFRPQPAGPASPSCVYFFSLCASPPIPLWVSWLPHLLSLTQQPSL